MKAWGDYINSHGRPRVPQGRGEGGRLEAEPDRRGERGRRRVRRLDRDGRHDRAVPAGRERDEHAARTRPAQATGLPDIAELQTEVAQQCSPVSFATLPTGSSCPYSGTGLRTFHVGYTQYDYYFKKFGATALHGVFVVPKDLPVDDRVDDADLPGREQDGHHERRRVR